MRGRLEHATDEDDRLFIDRDPEVFAVLLQFMRQRLAKNAPRLLALLVRCPWMVA